MKMQIRQDLKDDNLAVPIEAVNGNLTVYIDPTDPILTRWLNGGDDVFQVFYHGEWWNAYSIDWE